jgi:hypothetical protein
VAAVGRCDGRFRTIGAAVAGSAGTGGLRSRPYPLRRPDLRDEAWADSVRFPHNRDKPNKNNDASRHVIHFMTDKNIHPTIEGDNGKTSLPPSQRGREVVAIATDRAHRGHARSDKHTRSAATKVGWVSDPTRSGQSPNLRKTLVQLAFADLPFDEDSAEDLLRRQFHDGCPDSRSGPSQADLRWRRR